LIIKQSQIFLKYVNICSKQTAESKTEFLAENVFQYRLTKTKGN